MQVLVLLLILVLTTNGGSTSWQADDCGKQMTYENRNQVDPPVVVVHEIFGVVVDKDGVVAPGVCVAVFTEKDHLLVATITTNQDGKFRFDRLLKGDYRLVVKYPGFCPANIPLKLDPQSPQKTKHLKQLVVQLRLSGYDECSFAEYKSFSRKRSE